MGYIISDELREKKRRAGCAGSKARMETIQRARAAEKASRDHHLDEQSLQADLQKLRQELPGVEYDDFINLGEIVLSGIVWNKQYCQPERFDELEEDHEKPLIEQQWFHLSPD